jgi:hypothetical protein
MRGIRLIRSLLTLSGLAVLFILGLEVCARVDDFLTWGAPFFGHYSHLMLTERDELGVHSTHGTQFEKWVLDEHGFRVAPNGPTITVTKPEGIIRIAVLGASETFGLYESPGMDYPAQMQTMLDEVSPGRYQVLNAGCAGMTLPRFTFYYTAWIKQFQPDITVIYPTPASYLAIRRPRSEIEPEVHRPKQLGENLRLARKLKIVLRGFLPQSWQAWWRQRKLDRAIASKPPEWQWQQAPAERIKLFYDHLVRLLDEVSQSGSQIVLVTHAHRFPSDMAKWSSEDKLHMTRWREFCGRPSARAILEMEDIANKIIRKLGIERAIHVADVASAVPPMSKPHANSTAKPIPNFADFVHFTDAGAEIVASVLVNQILKML